MTIPDTGLPTSPADALRLLQEREATFEREFLALGSGAARLAHEIKNPVTSIHLALRAVARVLEEDELTVVAQLAERLENLELLVRRAFACVRPTEPKLAACELESLIEGAGEALRGNLERAGVTLECVGLADAPPIQVDAELCRAALVELLRNALEASPADARVQVEARLEGDEVLVCLSDEGPGLPAQLGERIFLPFVSSRHDAAGLGLAIARRNAQLCGGCLSPIDPSSPGARLELRLPRT